MQLLVDAILFDIDGTLIDSTPAVIRTWSRFAAERGLTVQEILQTSHGRRTEDTLADLLAAGQVEAAVAEMEQMEFDDLDDVVALPGVEALLMELPTERWAAVTSGSQRLMRARLQAAGLPIPRVMIGAEDVHSGKPDPEGFLAAAAALGMRPERCLVIEDAPAGIRAGRASGATVLAVATSHDEDELVEADAVIATMATLTVTPTKDGLRICTSAH